ncbi:MAG: hypothetical protein ACYDHH_30415, partial [Solirubrobacteraceae bacterium]
EQRGRPVPRSCPLRRRVLQHEVDKLAGRVLGREAPLPQIDALIRAGVVAKDIYDTYLHQLALYPLAARAFLAEIRAAGAPSQQHRRVVNDQFAELLRIPGSDDNPLARTAVIATSEEIVVREITDHGTEQLPKLAPTLTQLATRLLTPTPTPS